MTDLERKLLENARNKGNEGIKLSDEEKEQLEEQLEEKNEKFDEEENFVLVDIYKHIEESEKPEPHTFKGVIDELGRPGKQFKLYLPGLDDMEKPGVTELIYTNPKNHVMFKSIQLATKIRRFANINDMDVDFYDDIIAFIVKHYGVSMKYLERINAEEYIHIITFASGIASSPSNNKEK